jgi:hypothetical protein
MTWTARKVCDTRKPSRVAGRSKAPSSSMNRSAYRPHPSLYPEISHSADWNRVSGAGRKRTPPSSRWCPGMPSWWEKVCQRHSGTRPAGTVQTTTPGRAPSSVGGR